MHEDVLTDGRASSWVAKAISRRLDMETRVTANCLHPGVIASGFGHTDGGFFSVLVTIARPFFITPEKGARTQVYLASSPEVEGVTGKYFDKCKPARSNAASYDEASWARLWQVSDAMTSRVAKAA